MLPCISRSQLIRQLSNLVASGLALCFSPAIAADFWHLPEVISAQVPYYPQILRKAHFEGAVQLRVTTDGRRVSSVGVISGQPMLAKAAVENVKTWEFEVHSPVTLQVTFRYRLLDVHCGPDCECHSTEQPSIVLRLPSEVELSAEEGVVCDSAETR